MFIDVPGGKLFALRHGDRTADTIIGVGGWVGNSELWAEPFSLLSDRWSTIAYDHRGTGASVCVTESISLRSLVDDVFAVMDAFGVEKGVVAAESAGAPVALSAALEQPHRISHLVIVDGLYYSPAGSDGGDFERALRASYRETIRQFVEACIPEDGAGQLISWGRKMLERATPADAIRLLGVGRGIDIRPRLGEVAQPTLVIHGGLDVIVPLESSQDLAARLPTSQLEVIEDAGHVPTISRPSVVADLITAFSTKHRLPA